jgi:GT2 family glycosyltransferase
VEGAPDTVTKKAPAAVMTIAYNRATVLELCLAGIIHKAHVSPQNIYIVDNGSTESVSTIAQKFKVNYLRLDKNYFISRAINLGYSHFNIDQNYAYLTILGSDVLVDKTTITKQIHTLSKDPKIGMTGPAHIDIATKKLMNYAVTIDPVTSLLRSFLNPKMTQGANHFHSMYSVSTAAYDAVGGLDDVLFPMIFEEPDLGQRMMNNGYKIIPTPTAKIWHSLEYKLPKNQQKNVVVGQARLYNSPEKAYLFARNRIIYMRLHSSFLQFFIFLFVIHPIIALYYLLHIERQNIQYSMWGIVHGMYFALTKNRDYIKQKNKEVLGI